MNELREIFKKSLVFHLNVEYSESHFHRLSFDYDKRSLIDENVLRYLRKTKGVLTLNNIRMREGTKIIGKQVLPMVINQSWGYFPYSYLTDTVFVCKTIKRKNMRNDYVDVRLLKRLYENNKYNDLRILIGLFDD